MNTKELFERDNDRCMACGSAYQLTPQHRLNRKAGGRHGEALDAINEPQNLITLCWACNQRLESDAEFAAEGIRCGWKLQEYEDPYEVAVFVGWAREWRLLDRLGLYAICDGRDPDDRAMRWVVRS